jgi:hypothetical protein
MMLEIQKVRQEGEIKGIQIGKEEVNLVLLSGDKILSRENLKDSNKKLLILMNKFSKVERIQNQHAKISTLPCANGDLSEGEIKRTILFAIATKINE